MRRYGYQGRYPFAATVHKGVPVLVVAQHSDYLSVVEKHLLYLSVVVAIKQGLHLLQGVARVLMRALPGLQRCHLLLFVAQFEVKFASGPKF